MGTLELKKEIHSLVENINDDERLSMLYDLMLTLNAQTGSLRDTLTDDEGKELDDAVQESKSPENWISHDQVREDYKKWLSK